MDLFILPFLQVIQNNLQRSRARQQPALRRQMILPPRRRPLQPRNAARESPRNRCASLENKVDASELSLS